jgi:hypothetical protein
VLRLPCSSACGPRPPRQLWWLSPRPVLLLRQAIVPPGHTWAAGVAGAEVGVVVVVAAVMVVVVLVPAVVPVAALRHRDPNRVHLGPLSTTRGQGASPCDHSRGLFLRLVPRWPCSLVPSRGSPRRRGSPPPLHRPGLHRLPLHRGSRRPLLHHRLLHRLGWLVGTRPPWLPPRLPL